MPLGGLVPLPLPLGGSATDGWQASEHARLCADLLACVRTCPIAWMTGHTSSTSVVSACAQFGPGLSYAPTVVVNGTGDVTVTWSTSFSDALGNAEPLAIAYAEASIFGASAANRTVCAVSITAPNAVRVRTFESSAGTATDTSFFIAVF